MSAGHLFGAQPRFVALATDHRTGIDSYIIGVHAPDLQEAPEYLYADLLPVANCGRLRSR